MIKLPFNCAINIKPLGSELYWVSPFVHLSVMDIIQNDKLIYRCYIQPGAPLTTCDYDLTDYLKKDYDVKVTDIETKEEVKYEVRY